MSRLNRPNDGPADGGAFNPGETTAFTSMPEIKMVVHCKSGKAYDVYIGRPSKWGNPFVIGRDGSRQDVIDKYRNSITPEMRDAIKRELKGKVLACWCSPQACHGDVLAEIANG
jgi:hypothetical protein